MAKHQYATKPPNISTMPPGVPYIIGNEAAERFSFYGMRSILIVFMTSQLLPVMGDAEARGWVSVFIGSIYALSVVGAILAEGFLGKYRTILYLSVVYCLGHVALALMDTSWGVSIGQRWVLAIGLALIAFGGGGIKPCVSANVGDQFGQANNHLLSKVFGWFYFSINAGSFVATLLIPWLLVDPRFGPAWAFGVPGVAMFIATVFFWAGRNKFVHIPPAGLGFFKEMFSSEGLRTLRRLAGIYIFIAVFWSLWDQSVGHAWTLQAERMDLNFLGFQLLPAQVNTANAIMILLFIPLVNYVLYPLVDRFFPLTPLRKIGIGLFLTAGSFLVIAYVQLLIDGGARPTIWWQMLAYAVLTLGEVMVSITGLEFSYTQAPNKMKSAVMSLWLLTVAVGNYFTAGVNFIIENDDGTKKMNDLQYYLFFAGLMAVTACAFTFVARYYRGRTYIQGSDDEVAVVAPVLGGGAPT